MVPVASTGYEFWLFLHITFALVGFGMVFSLLPIIRFAEKNASQSLIDFYKTMLRLSRFLITPAITVVFISGLILIGESPYGFADGWISASFAVIIAIFALLGAAITPGFKRLVALSETQETKSKEHKRAALQLRALILATDLLVVVAIFLMVTKPGS